MKFWNTGLGRQWIAAFVITLSMFILGNALAWPSPVLVSLLEKNKPFHMSTNEISWMVSVVYIGNLSSPFPCGWAMDVFGRKLTLLVSALIPSTAWIICHLANKAYHLYIARTLAGAWVGITITVVPIYLGEISDPNIRGATGTLVQVMINLGVIFTYAVGRFVSYYTLIKLSAMFPVIFILTLWFIPESHYWLLTKQKKEKAIKSLAWFKGNTEEEVQSEINDLEEKINATTKPALKDMFATRGRRKAHMMVQFSAFIQRMSGISCYYVFASTTLPHINKLTPIDSTLILGVVSFLGLFITLAVVDKCKRITIFVTSSIGCGLANFSCGVWYLLRDFSNLNVYLVNWFPLVMFNIFFIMFNLGLGPIASVIQGETLPTNYRASASAITSTVLAATSFLTNKMYHPIQESVGVFLNFWIFSTACFLGAFIAYFFFLETKGKTLYEVQLALENDRKI